MTARAIPSKRARRALALVLVSASLLATGGYWLAGAPTASLAIGTPPGLIDGLIADVTPLSVSVTRVNGGATLQSGKTIAKGRIASPFVHRSRVSIAWINPYDAAKVLGNRNAQISIGFYYPVSTPKTTSPRCHAGTLEILDGATALCLKQDTGARGSFSVSSTGTLFLAQNILGGYLLPSVDVSAATAACAQDTASSESWCQPSDLASSAQRRFYLVASLQVPGTIPQGQQLQLGSLSFFVKIRRTRQG